MKILFYFASLLLTVLLVTVAPAIAAWTTGEGDQYFGPETSEAAACRAAEESARLDALRKLHGELLSIDQQLSCRESNGHNSDNAQCHLNKILWSQIGGEIKASKLVKKDVREIAGSKVCHVELVADVSIKKGRPDPGFDIEVRVNQSSFRAGEKISIELVPSQPMYVSIFNWLPYFPEEKQVVRLFPNPHDTDAFIDRRRFVPGTNYSFKIMPSDFYPEARSFVDEYLLVVITKQPVKWLESYSLSELRSRLAELPADQVRYIKRGYQLLLPSSSKNQELP